MGLFSTIGSFFSSALGAIGGAIATALGALGPQGLLLVGGLISSVIGALIGDKEDPEELGEKVLQAEERGIGKQNDESFLDARKRFDEFDIDPEKKHDPALAKSVGLAYQIQCGAERGKDISEFALAAAKLFNAGSLDENVFKKVIVMTTSTNELNDMGKMINGKLESHEAINQCLDKLAQATKAANPTMSDNDAYGEALKYRA